MDAGPLVLVQAAARRRFQAGEVVVFIASWVSLPVS